MCVRWAPQLWQRHGPTLPTVSHRGLKPFILAPILKLQSCPINSASEGGMFHLYSFLLSALQIKREVSGLHLTTSGTLYVLLGRRFAGSTDGIKE